MWKKALAVFALTVVTLPCAFAEDPVPAELTVNYSGKTMRRLPVNTLPENVFLSLSNEDFEKYPEAPEKVLDLYAKNGSFNLVTLTLRCRNDLSNPATFLSVSNFAVKAKALGIAVHMDIDPRIAREEFLKRWPEDAQREIYIVTSPAVNGKAEFKVAADFLGDHMTGGTRGYEATKGRIVAAYALKFDAKGVVDASSVRKVNYALKAETMPLTGTAEGLKDGETLAVVAEFELFSCDVFSPHLIPFVREMMERYAKLPISGAMHDEWGFPPAYGAQMEKRRAFWYSPHYAAAYAKASNGRSLMDDYLLFTFPFSGRGAERSQAIKTFMWLNLLRQKEIEEAFYNNDKEIFGPETYVTKHSTWFSELCPEEYAHDGLSWWVAKRDWAQSDECAPVPACTGMAKKFGGPCWLNEWYSIDAKTYSRNVWRYALTGGRVVYHPLYGGNNPLEKLPYPVRSLRRYSDLLTPDAVRAQCRVRLVNLISRGQIDCPAAVVFSHKRVMDWNDPAWNDTGEPLMYSLWCKGYATDTYPADEFALGTFTIDKENYLRVGKQRYTALVLYRLSPEEMDVFRKLVQGRNLRTKLFYADTPVPENATALPQGGNRDEPIVAALAAAKAVRQTPLTQDGNRYPEPDGTIYLTDGTAVRMAARTNVAGDPLEETLTLGDMKIAFKAQGLFGARQGTDGNLEAVAAGGLTSLDAKGMTLKLAVPQDIALLKFNGHWHGIWQTFSKDSTVPAELLAITPDWTRLLLPEPLEAR